MLDPNPFQPSKLLPCRPTTTKTPRTSVPSSGKRFPAVCAGRQHEDIQSRHPEMDRYGDGSKPMVWYLSIAVRSSFHMVFHIWRMKLGGHPFAVPAILVWKDKVLGFRLMLALHCTFAGAQGCSWCWRCRPETWLWLECCSMVPSLYLHMLYYIYSYIGCIRPADLNISQHQEIWIQPPDNI